MCLIHLFVYLLLSHLGAKTVNPTLEGKENNSFTALLWWLMKGSSVETVPKLAQICRS